MEVLIYGDNFEDGLRAFIKKYKDSGLSKELKERSYHLSRSQRRKQKNKEALKRSRKRLIRMEERARRWNG